MNRRFLFLPALLAFIGFNASSQSLAELIGRLRSLEPYASYASAEIRPSGADAPVLYDVRLWSSSSSSDSISPCRYLIEYTHPDADAPRSFAALVDTAMYRYDGSRFQEYSLSRHNLTRQLAVGTLFADLLPAMIADELRDASDNPFVSIDISNAGPDRLTVTLTTKADSVVYAQKEFTFSRPECYPVAVSSVSNIGMPSEISYRAEYSSMSGPFPQVTDSLIYAMQGSVMGRFAGDNLSPESFIGTCLPDMKLPEMKGGRYAYTPRYPTLFIFIDDTAAADGDDALEAMMQAVRPVALEAMGGELDLIFILRSRYADAIYASEAPARNEHVLLGADGYLRQLGARSLPLFIYVDGEGIVQSVAHGVNNDPASIVRDMISE